MVRIIYSLVLSLKTLIKDRERQKMYLHAAVAYGGGSLNTSD